MNKNKHQRGLSPDAVRQKILEFLRAKRGKARSLASVAAPVTEIKKGLKPLGISQNEAVVNLDFLVQHGWVLEEIERRTYRSARGFDIPSEKRTYKLSDLGISHFEGISPFSRSGRFAGINVQTIGGVTVLGNHNVVRAEFLETFRQLQRLEDAMKMSSAISEEQKLIAKAEIETIKDQLAKPVPDPNIVRTAMEGIAFLASIPGLVDLFHIVQRAVSGLLK
jgi:hypothetical protein